jgi:hypothetical protein
MVYLGSEFRYGNENTGVPDGAATRETKEALCADALTSERVVEAMKLGEFNGTLSPYKRNYLYAFVTVIVFLSRCNARARFLLKPKETHRTKPKENNKLNGTSSLPRAC